MVYAYLFEAKGVQRYLFTSGRLRDVVGASDLVGRIAASDGDDVIGRVLASKSVGAAVVTAVTCGSDAKDVSFSRRAGAAFCLHSASRETLVNVRREIRLRVMSALPGLEISDAFGEGADEIASMKDAFANSGGARANMVASILPLGRPVTAITPRTGLPKVAFKNYGSDEEPIDIILRAQRERADILQRRMGSDQIDGVAKSFNGEVEDNRRYVYPRNFDETDPNSAHNPIFPWREGSDRRVGFIHADLSGLGEAFANAGSKTAAENLALGQKIEEAIVSAIVAANDEILRSQSSDIGEFHHIVPARPLVIGGDDITLIVRADLALPFAARFLELIEKTTKNVVLGGLSAGAGVAIAHHSLPFLTLNALAESLCTFAKKRAKAKGKKPGEPWPSMLAFHVQTQTAEEDYGRHIHPTLAVRGEGALTGNPYAIGAWAADTGALPYAKLAELAKAIQGLPGARNTLRKIRGDIANDRSATAKDLWHRMFSRTDRDDEQNDHMTTFKVAYQGVFGTALSEYEIPTKSGALFDALELVDIGTVDTGTVSSQPVEDGA